MAQIAVQCHNIEHLNLTSLTDVSSALKHSSMDTGMAQIAVPMSQYTTSKVDIINN